MGTGYHASSRNPALWDLGAEQDVNEVGHSWYARQNGEAERVRSLDDDDPLECHRLNDRLVGRLDAFANARGINAKVANRARAPRILCGAAAPGTGKQ